MLATDGGASAGSFLDNLFSSAIAETFTISSVVIMILSSLAIGFFISAAYMLTNKKKGWQQSFILTLVMLPAVISIIIILIGNNAARALSLAGAFSIIRFRSAPGDAKDISYVFFSLAVGLACGMGFIAYAALFAVIVCLVMFVAQNLNYAAPSQNELSIKITIPENLNYQGLYDDLFEKNTTRWILKRVKTTDFGSLFELQYDVNIKNGADQKAFIDEIRRRNGNLPVQFTLKEFEEQQSI